MMRKSWAVMGNQAHRNGDSRGVQPRLTSTFLGADDGIRTRDPHLGKYDGQVVEAYQRERLACSGGVLVAPSAILHVRGVQ